MIIDPDSLILYLMIVMLVIIAAFICGCYRGIMHERGTKKSATAGTLFIIHDDIDGDSLYVELNDEMDVIADKNSVEFLVSRK